MIAIMFLTLLFHVSDQPEQTSLRVKHEHTLGSCDGTLTFSAVGVRYDTKEKGHSKTWSYPEVKYFEIVSPKEIYIHSYEDSGVLRLGQDRDYDFRVTEGQISNDIYKLLVDKSPRAIVTHVIFSGTEIVQEIPVRHRHGIAGGCQGVLTIADDKIIYKTYHKSDSRIWRLKDIGSFASADPFQLRLTTPFETFSFDLKLPLEERAYEHIWKAVNRPDVQTYAKPQ